MNKTRIGIDTTNLQEDDAFGFIAAVRQVLYSGRGAKPQFAKWLDLNETDALRALLGAPADWWTHERMAFFETAYADALGLPLKPRPQLWTEQPGWTLHNPRAVEASIEQCQLALEFMDRFGFTDNAWDGHIFHMASFMARTKRTHDSADDRRRAYYGLAMLGFRRPDQFFIPARGG